MSAIVDAFLADMTDDDLDRLAEKLAPRLLERIPTLALAARSASEKRAVWLNSDQAAEHLGCPRSRIHDLVQLGKLEPRRDGRRLLFRREELDAYLEGTA